ncbi:sodium bicarbonate cotransporter 3-like isoform X1 [Haliotis rufescens]|uniref:sodium bicarbonate cotransporter 3-like isoform X1 n=1 Tax=Haliotis rufescens TaxID=6454 RepID=UPI001EAFC04E|nr:sodium bicarbonate cotransporter 3-like isoform X1 [Haliotis rufescens]XP_046332974.1 sodium bicarbonate cotransporter 3-like isoform X1 [Haliotis rufescens]
MGSENKDVADKRDLAVGKVKGPGGKVFKRSTSMYLNVVAPHKPIRPSIVEEDDIMPDGSKFTLYGDDDYVPSERIQSLLNSVTDIKHRAHKVFSEMDVLKKRGEDFEWREVARWVKYEEKMEEGGERWSKPHVASLSMHHLVETRRQLMDGVIHLDTEAYSISQVVEKFLDEWIKLGQLDPLLRQHVRTLLLKHHRHGAEKGEKKKGKGDMNRTASTNSFSQLTHVSSQVSLNHNLSHTSLESLDSDLAGNYTKKQNERILRKIPKGAEVANIMIGAVDELSSALCGFMRLNDGRCLGDISEVNLPTRFVFLLVGPPKFIADYMESGRCLGTMMVDDIFREVAYKCRNKDDLVAGIDEFLEQVTVLPPGEWDPKIRIEPPDAVPNQQFRKTPSSADFFEGDMVPVPGGDDDEDEGHADPDLNLSCRPFLGLIRDIRRKAPFYMSDFKDAIHIQCIASFIYIFLATLTPNVTFGGILGQSTNQYMGVMECIFAAAVTGIAFALFAGQPLNILGSTGPMLVLEKIIYDICKDQEWDFLPFRAWIGIWTAGFLLLIVMWDLSALVKYITRFTEESFACLIAFIFIYEAFVKLGEIGSEEAPVELHPSGNFTPRVCHCTLPDTITTMAPIHDSLNHTLGNMTTTMASVINNTMDMSTNGMEHENMTHLSKEECKEMFGTWHCVGPVPDAFMFSIILYFGTFGIAIFCVTFKTFPCFPTFVRQIISDFGVLIAIVLMVVVDYLLGLPTPKLTVPEEFKPTRSDRGWFINPVSEKNPWWLALAAGLPAIIGTILIFMDQQITAVIVNRKENLLKKGKGYHLDLFVLCILVTAHSLLGLPWYVAATVSAIAHIQSLRKESESTAPGDKPAFLGVREQRVTALLVGILSGLAVLITNVLKVIPMPVLYGVFFYMGFSALKGMQFIDRLLLFFMPSKYQPDYPYLRHVRLWRVHIFTFVQVLCLVALWVVKSIKSISIGFPLLVVFTGVVRKILDCVFSQYELKYLDDLLPNSKKDKVKDSEKNEKSEPAFKNINGNGLDKHNIVGSDEKKHAFYISNESQDYDNAYQRKGEGIRNNAFDTKL